MSKANYAHQLFLEIFPSVVPTKFGAGRAVPDTYAVALIFGRNGDMRSMTIYRTVQDMRGLYGRTRLIERVSPGQETNQFAFKGTEQAAEAETARLTNLLSTAEIISVNAASDQSVASQSPRTWISFIGTSPRSAIFRRRCICDGFIMRLSNGRWVRGNYHHPRCGAVPASVQCLRQAWRDAQDLASHIVHRSIAGLRRNDFELPTRPAVR
jgi:hypothetical protein